MKNYISLILLALSSLLFADMKQQTLDIITERYPLGTATFEKYEIPTPLKKSIENESGQKFLKDFVYLWRIEQDGKIFACAIADAVRGKSAFMTTCVLINSTGKIEQLDILNYNGDRGREVTNIMWLEQFNGKTAADDFNIGGDVDAISGATISATAVARGAKRWCLLAQSILASERR